MNTYLVFRIAAALASTGDVAAQARRDVERWPARSSVLGIVGAALGLRRDDTASQTDLQEGYDVGVKVREAGTLLRDYHTVQTVPGSVVKRPDSRAEALWHGHKKGNLNTILTEREYREGMYAEVLLHPRVSARWSLSQLASALQKPAFILYFGRKACPLTSPVYPQLVDAEDVRSAFSSYALLEAHAASPEQPHEKLDTIMALDVGLADNLSYEGADRVRRWDAALSRQRWQFAERELILITETSGDVASL